MYDAARENIFKIYIFILYVFLILFDIVAIIR